MNAEDLSQVEPDYISKTNFFWKFQNNLQIFSDQKTLLGVQWDQNQKHSNFVMENIKRIQIGYFLIRIRHYGDFIYNILLDEDNSCFFVGGKDLKVLQFSTDFRGNFGRIIKVYKILDLGKIFCSCSLGDKIAFGGTKKCIGFIDVKKRKTLKIKLQVAPLMTLSMQLYWETQKQFQTKALLAVSGHLYDNINTDIFDVTQFIANSIEFTPKVKGKSNTSSL